MQNSIVKKFGSMDVKITPHSVLKEAPNAVKFLDWLKKFGLAQNIFGPVKGQGNSVTRPGEIPELRCH